MTDQKPILAGLLATALAQRYPNQVQGEAQREDYIRAAMEGDPVVYLEAAWSWWREGEKGRFLPTPGDLIRHAKETWAYDREPYLTLARALERGDPGCKALLARFGSDLEKEAREAIKPSHERAWLEANLEHRVYVEAKRRMERRGSPPFNPSEVKGLNLPAWPTVAAALGTPAVRSEAVAELPQSSALAEQKRLR